MSMFETKPNAFTIEAISMFRYILKPLNGYQVTLFKRADGGADAMFTSRNADDTVHYEVSKPFSPTYQLACIRLEDGSIEVIYHAGAFGTVSISEAPDAF